MKNRMIAKEGKRVLVFGVFDLFHKGHKSFLKQAKKYGGELVVLVARDSVVKQLKGKRPHQNEKARLAVVSGQISVAKAMLGDKIQGSYAVLRKIKPNVICFGYDQQQLKNDLREKMHENIIATAYRVTLRAHQSHLYKTSKIYRKLRKGNRNHKYK